MIAAIYARKSTEQNVADEAKSVVRQVENARAFAAARGWTVAHVFVDDGISGAEFEKRPGFMRMMACLPRPPFGVLVVSERKTIGREMSQTSYVIKQWAEAGVEIFEYMHGKSLTPKNAMDKVVGALQGFTDEKAREESSERVHEAHTRLHKAGRVVGGRVFGYRNRVVYNGIDRDGNPLRSHVEREVNDVEAAVVRRIFALYDAGEGLKRIAKMLTQEGAAAPKHFRRADGLAPVVGWASSTVRSVLTRETYRGVVIWNKTRKRNASGKWDPSDRPESEWIRTTNDALIIIDDPLWRRVASRREEVEGKAVRFESGRISGRPPKHATQNLLAGLATCGVCGGGLVVETGGKKRGRIPEYICHRHRTNGACSNALRMPVEDMNEAILQAVEEHALTPEAIEQVIHLTERDDVVDQQAALDRERHDVEKRIKRLVAAIETGGEAASLVAKLRELEARRRAIDAEAAALRPVPRLAPAVLENRLSEWRRLLRASTTQGRTVLQRILRGRLTFTPIVHAKSGEVSGYKFTGPTRFDRLFSGIAVDPAAWTPLLRGYPRIMEGEMEAVDPADTPEADYGRLLEAASMRKGWCARRESNPRPTGSKPVALSI
jgi:site-specific DNA recombinase